LGSGSLNEEAIFSTIFKLVFPLSMVGLFLFLMYRYRTAEERRLDFDRFARELGFTSDDPRIEETDVLSETPGSGRSRSVIVEFMISAIRLLGLQSTAARKELKALLSHFRLFKSLPNANIMNLLTKDSRGGKIYIFEGVFRKKNNTRPYYRTAFVFVDKGLDFPECTVIPKKQADRLYRFLGFIGLDHKDIDVEFDPEFSEAYVVRGADELKVREIVNAGVCRWFMGFEEDNPHFESRGSAFIVFFDGKKFDIDEVRKLFYAASEFLQMWGH
jgi:hypothetical protein